nr:regulating synaptic membrane exocytosis protein 2 isoform X3 [Halyomorpha halys]
MRRRRVYFADDAFRRKQDEVEVLEETIRQRNEQHKKAGVELEATCHICLKTKFADGIGHVCNYCSIRCCARCGGKVTLRSNKVIWVCILCRKKQELLSKTGQWINKGMTGSDSAVMRRIEADMSLMDKRPKLERAHSAAEKENQPLTRSGSSLRRQYSQQDAQAKEEELRFYRGEIEGLMRSQGYPQQQPEYRNDSFSSEQSSSMEVSGGKKHRRAAALGKKSGPPPQRSFSSSDDELRSTPECTSCEEHETEKAVTEAVERRRKKTVRFGAPAPGKDSGIDTSSTFTSSEDSNSTPKHPMSWQVSKDGRTMIGHMVLKKSLREGIGSASSASILGLKVVGGKLLESGSRGALIEKVKKGSIADIDGQLRPGDEVLEWNGRSLKGKSFQEVYDIIAESKHEPQVELVVCRYQTNRHPRLPYPPVQSHKDVYDVRKDKPSVLVTSPGSPDIHGHSQRIRPRHSPNSNVGGRIQVKLWFDSGALQLVVTLVCAAGLIPRSNGQPRNPYAKLFLLPDRSEKSKRRTKTLANTNDPKWNQSFVYSSVRRADLKLRVVEITVWDYVRYGANDFLGEVLIELSVALLENEAEWFHLSAHDEIIAPHTMDIERDLDVVVTPTEHLSPSTTSRLSDSDPSDLDDSRERRVADGASISSVGSSNSPPPDIEMSEKRKSRRDMSPQGRKSMMIQFGTPVAEPHRKIPVNQRSHSAAPTDSPSVHTRSRSKSPHRSLSPPEYSYRRAVLPSHAYVPRFTSRSATATPITSPKKRQLPQIPPHPTHHSTYRDRVSYDVDDRPHTIKQRPRNVQHRGWSRHGVTGLSESDLSQDIRHRSPPDKEHGENCDSDMESVASITSSAFSTQSERPKGSRYSEYGGTVKTPLVGGGEPQNNSKRAPFSRSLSNADVPAEEHGSLSDTALIRQQTGGSRRKTPSGSSPAPKSSSGMGKKSSSTSQLSATGRKRRLGFGTKGKSSFTVHRSEEVVPDDIKHLVKQGSSVSSDGEGSQDGDSWAPSLKGSDGDQLTGFLDGVGPAQLVGRQVLVDPALGEIQLSMCYQKGYLEVEVIRARGLQAKANSKTLPAPYVKVYLVCGKKCLAKAKTTTARRTLDPLYQQQLTFRGPFRNCILQVTVWGDYGRMEGKKVFMGVAQILLDHLNLQNLNIGWYKLYGTSSLVSGPPFLALSRGTSLASLDSLKHSS